MGLCSVSLHLLMYARGVSILVKKKIHFTLCRLTSDQRYLIIHCILHNMLMSLINVYIPPPFHSAILDEIMARVLVLPAAPICIMGDLNCMMDPQKDNSPPGMVNRTPLKDRTTQMETVDVWKWRHPGESAFLFQSAMHHTLSRIDHIIATQNFLTYIHKADFPTRALSDHSPMQLHLNIGVEQHTSNWRLNPSWLKEEEISQKAVANFKQYWEIGSEGVHPKMVWDKSSAQESLMQSITSKRGVI